ncbi:M56 family metallopeptidase [uncultured Paraglaciecola sp.]|uniref:M56 family metallopeptidase n=1 Tax=uncultured Paraglaciecola sp. TaxID=1765024 RepID=UPI0030D86818|tara:strand:- start:72875 stop:74491 length:1617 start_codon:yes stop_codon:yes gene_type:complete
MMTTYFTITLLISSICGLGILLLHEAPARLRFYICLMILVTWLTPWQFMQFQAVSNSFTLPLNILTEFKWNIPEAVIQNPSDIAPVIEQSTFPLFSFYWLWLAAFAIGLVLFFKDLVSYVKLHRDWIKHSTLDNQTWKTAQITQPNCDIRRINSDSPGMATGLTKPIIWLDNNQQDAEKIRTIVLHELTHIRQHDPIWLWAITLMQRLFWWNPLVGLTANYARKQMELSCDEQCKKHLPEGNYQLQLIKLTLQVNKQQQALQMPAVLQMSGTPAFNLQRINKLNKEHKMKKRYVVVMASLLSLTSWIGFSNATVNSQQPVNFDDKNSSLIDVLHALNDKDFTGAEAQLTKLANNIDSFKATDQAKIWKLHAHTLYELDANNPQIITYIDKAVALEESLTATELLPILHMAQSLAASQGRWDKQISYSDKWFEIADDNLDKKKILYLTAISHYKLKQTATSIKLLDELVAINEIQGYQPEETWLNMLFGNHVESENWIEALAVQEKLAMLYPSEKNLKQLENMSQIKTASRIEKISKPL